MNLISAGIETQAHDLAAALAALPLAERVAALNRVREILHESSPFQAEPVDCVLWVLAESVQANDYNPNHVASPEMKLLTRSIQEDGYTQPIVAMPEGENYTVVDGFHRNRVGKENPVVRKRIQGYLPITRIRASQAGMRERIAATIRHNRARGVHAVMPMSDIVARLIREGWTDTEVAQELGMDADEVLRFKQVVGLPELFAGQEYSKAWE